MEKLLDETCCQELISLIHVYIYMWLYIFICTYTVIDKIIQIHMTSYVYVCIYIYINKSVVSMFAKLGRQEHPSHISPLEAHLRNSSLGWNFWSCRKWQKCMLHSPKGLQNMQLRFWTGDKMHQNALNHGILCQTLQCLHAWGTLTAPPKGPVFEYSIEG